MAKPGREARLEGAKWGWTYTDEHAANKKARNRRRSQVARASRRVNRSRGK